MAWNCDSCLKLAAYCLCYDDRADRIEHKASWLVEQAYDTEDGQAKVIDPTHWAELRHALDMPTEQSCSICSLPFDDCKCSAEDVRTAWKDFVRPEEPK